MSAYLDASELGYGAILVGNAEGVRGHLPQRPKNR